MERRSARPASPVTASADFATGARAPVSSASSTTSADAVTTRASAGTSAPGSTTITSPGTRSAASTSVSSPSQSTLASLGRCGSRSDASAPNSVHRPTPTTLRPKWIRRRTASPAARPRHGSTANAAATSTGSHAYAPDCITLQS